VIAVWAFLPATRTSWVRIEGFYVDSKSVLLVASAVCAVLGLPLRSRASGRMGRRVIGWATAVVVYAAISMCWGQLSAEDHGPMIFTLLATLSAAWFGYAVVQCQDPAERVDFVWRLTVLVAVVALLYSTESILALKLRSAAASWWTDFGIQRVRGPLFGAATGHFVLLPALGVSLWRAFTNRAQRTGAMCAALCLCTGLLGLGSRAALASVAAFGLLTTVAAGNRKRWRSLCGLVLMECVAGALVFSRANVGRLLSLEDAARMETHLTALAMVNGEPAALRLIGAGYGSVWPWYRADVEYGGAYASGSMLRATPFGPMLYHPHSTVLLAFVELGVVGVVAMVALWTCLVWCVGRHFGSPRALFASALLASSVGMLFDLMLFKNWPLSAIWWIFVFSALEMPGRVREWAGAGSGRRARRASPARHLSRGRTELGRPRTVPTVKGPGRR
jgi:hypothetical protein